MKKSCKRLTALLLALAMLFALAGCGSNSSSEAESSTHSSSATTSESSVQSESGTAPELSAVAEESSSTEEEEAESSTKNYATEIYTVGKNLTEGGYLITCTETTYSLEVLVFTDESDYEAFQDAMGLTYGEYRIAVETYAWADGYVEQDAEFYIRLEDGNVLVLDDGEYELQKFDSSESATLYSGLYVVGEDIAVGEYDVICDSDSLHMVTFAGKEEYLAYHSTDRASVGDEVDALEQYAADSDYSNIGDISVIRLENSMILIVENGTGTLSEWYPLSE